MNAAAPEPTPPDFRPVLALAAAILWLLAIGMGPVLAADPVAPTPADDRAARPARRSPIPWTGRPSTTSRTCFATGTRTAAESIADGILSQTGVQVVVYTQTTAGGSADPAADATALMTEWGVGRAAVDDGLVILFDSDRTKRSDTTSRSIPVPGSRRATSTRPPSTRSSRTT